MSDPFVLTFNWTVEDVLLAAKERDISITEEQASQLLEENAEHLAQIEGAAVSDALGDCIGESFEPDGEAMSQDEVDELNKRLSSENEAWRRSRNNV